MRIKRRARAKLPPAARLRLRTFDMRFGHAGYFETDGANFKASVSNLLLRSQSK